MRQNEFHSKLRQIMDEFVHKVYDVAKNFPKEEIFGLTNQFRRSALSIILNYIEEFARRNRKVMKTFFEISYGSLKEAKYLVCFAKKRGFISEEDNKQLLNLSEEIGAMFWTVLSKM